MKNFKLLAAAVAAFIISSPLFAKNVTNGTMNFSLTDTGKRVVQLNGDWEFYANQTFTSLLGAQLKVDFIETPASWSKKRIDKPSPPPIGCHTYRMMITGLRPNYEYAIFSRKSPALSALFYANGNLVMECGKFSRHKEDFKAAQFPIYTRIMSNESGWIELVVQVSNFTGGKSGIISPIFFGENAAAQKFFLSAMLMTAAILGGLIFILIMHFSFWSFNKSNTANYYFAILIMLVGLRQVLLNFNCFGLMGLLPPFALQFKAQNLAMFAGAIFGILRPYDKVFTANYPSVDKTLSAITFGMLIFFVCLPEKISMQFLNVMAIWAMAFALYALFRCGYSIKTSQRDMTIYTLFFALITIPIVIDHFSESLLTSACLRLSEISALALTIFDIIMIAARFEILQKKAIYLKNESSKFHLSARRFIPRNLTKLTGEDISKKLKIGSSLEDKLTIMQVGFKVIAPDNTPINLRDAFEATGFYSATIIDQINKNNGSVISISSQGISALFKSSSPDALDTAREIRDLIQTINARRAEDYYPCISFNISIHQSNMLVGIVGDRTRIDFTIISSGIEVTEKMLSLGFAMNIPILISEPTVKVLPAETQGMLKLLGQIHFSEFARPIGLYGVISSEEEETSLVNLDESPFITQTFADKYINY